MDIRDQQAQVLIVGAGPSGLMMAAQLLRYGIRPLVIDSKSGPTTHSNALGVQARSLEIYRQLGLSSAAVDHGRKAAGLRFMENGEALGTLALANVAFAQTPFPYILIYPQFRNERLLLDYLTAQACPVYWKTDLLTLKTGAFGTEALLAQESGQLSLHCDWLIAADGAHSTVRKQLGIPFAGDTYQQHFYLADVQAETHFPAADEVQLFFSRTGFCGFFPMPGKNCYRIIGNLPESPEVSADPSFEDLLPHLERVCGFKLHAQQLQWFSTYRLHHRMAERFRAHNCFLIGDAAHIHSPVGAQGMNTGLQDAYNLAWKLAGVIRGALHAGILDSYANERIPVAKTVLATSDRVFRLLLSRNWFSRKLRTWIVQRLIYYLGRHPAARVRAFRWVSQIAINYRNSRLSVHLSRAVHVRAGDRLPLLPIYDEKREVSTDLHEWCNKPGFTLIVLGRLEELFLFQLARWISGEYQGQLNFFYLPPSGRNIDVFNAFEVPGNGQKAIVVRPDMYIGYMSDLVSIAMLDNYLRNVAGLRKA